MRKFTFEIEEEEAQPLHELHRNEVMDCRFRRGAVVQLVRIPACHAVGREFESRPHRFSFRREKPAKAGLLFKTKVH